MTDRVIDEVIDEEVPEIPEELEKIMLLALDEGRAKIEAAELLVPFTALAVKENLFIESHPGDSADDCFDAAQATVAAAAGASCYAFCYDGMVEDEDGDLDCIIAEGGIPGEEFGYAIGYVYEMEGDVVVSIDEEPVFIGEAPNFMAKLKPASAYSDKQISKRYLTGEDFDAE